MFALVCTRGATYLNTANWWTVDGKPPLPGTRFECLLFFDVEEEGRVMEGEGETKGRGVLNR